MSRFLRENSLTLAFLVLFLATLVGQAFVGHADFNHAQIAHQNETISLGRYVTSSSFAVDVTENWQSEFLAIASMVVFSIWLRQRGSTQSKPVGEPHTSTGAEG